MNYIILPSLSSYQLLPATYLFLTLMPPPLSLSDYHCYIHVCVNMHKDRSRQLDESIFGICVYMISGLTSLHWAANRGLIPRRS